MPDRDQLFWLFFRFSGRVSRAAYFLAGMLLAIVQAFLLYRFTLVPQGSTEGQLWAMAFWAVVLVSIWSNVALGVKRLHDIDRPGIIAASLFIPVISIIAFLVLCIFPGTPGPNRYGAATNQPK
ncbi:DUF805 domain-containing protein [Mesorhizobium sp. AaZ16]|uniref:DUF805 domain-containing protein n=1 Tax=Mesorhizobium sp. AaZ16 TaxID=3402289 RepID=UPI00374F231E